MNHRQQLSRFSSLVLLAVSTVTGYGGPTRADEAAFTLDEPTRRRCLAVLEAGIASDEFWPAMHAAEALTHAGQEAAVRERLGPLLEREGDDQRRCGLARELVRAGDSARLAVLAEIVAGAAPHGHTHAAESLFKLGEEGDEAALRRHLAQTERPEVRLMAAAALARRGDSAAREVLRGMLPVDDPKTFRVAAWALGTVGDQDDIEPLRARLAAAADELSRAYVEHALACLGDEAGLKAVTRNLTSADPQVRTYAAEAAGKARAVETAGRLTDMLGDPWLDARIRAAHALLLLDRPPAAEPPAKREIPGTTVVLELPSGPGNPRNSEGSFVALEDGRILFAYSRYRGERDWGDHATADIAARVSADGGRTWSPKDRILVPNEGRCNVMSASLLRLADGRIALFYLRKNSLRDCRLWMRTSADEAATWSEPVLCIPAPGYFVVNNDRVVQLAGGRLVVPAAFHRARQDGDSFRGNALDERGIVMFFLSDDAGATWRESKDWLAFPGKCASGLQEPGAIERQDGTLLGWCRTEAGWQYETESRDRGETWSVPKPSSFRSPNAPLSIKRLPGSGHLLAVWNDHSTRAEHGPTDWKSSSWGRTPLTLAVSRDDGRSWQTIGDLEPDPTHGFCYTAIHGTADAVLLAYCCGGGATGVLQDSRIRRIPLTALEQPRPTAAGSPPPRRVIPAEHGVVCRLPGERFGYFGWPTVARMDDGRLMVASSGLRAKHICPFGKTVLHESTDDGRSWSESRVIQDSPIDDRDAGIVNLGGKSLLVSWFRSDTRLYAADEKWTSDTERAAWRDLFKDWKDEQVAGLIGSWAMRSDDGGATWGEPVRVPVSAPHGPIRLAGGDLLYLGKPFGAWDDMAQGQIAAARSSDGGTTWKVVGRVPVAPRTDAVHYHEPHVVELSSGRLVAAIRLEDNKAKPLKAAGLPHFTIMQTESADGGVTWSVPRWLGFKGSPPHLLRHSSGALVMSYGYRDKPYGQRVAISRDDGATWHADWILRGDGPDSDLGYPSTVELGDGSLLTVCYQRAAPREPPSLLWSRWNLPAARMLDMPGDVE
jgi:sialidase-1